jgi:hypothetical protein
VTPRDFRRCEQCWKDRPIEQFRGERKALVRWCLDCRRLYRGGGVRESRRVGLHSDELRVLFIGRSGNAKLGPIPSSITSGETCPDACGLKDAGCYAEFGVLGAHWRRVPSDGLTWAEFLQRVKDLPPQQVWRHNTAGDLPGVGDRLDIDRFLELVWANRGRRGFTMTRKPLRGALERHAVVVANRMGFVVNVTAHGLAEADELAARYARRAPIVVVLPEDAPARLTTPMGRPVVVCPAQTRPHVTCSSCQLCSRAQRLPIIGFRAHGQWKANVNRLVQLRRVS